MATKNKKAKKRSVAPKKTLFFSDVHLGPGAKWDLFSVAEEGPEFVGFLEYVAKRQRDDHDIKELVLLGDIFDLWTCPYNEEPPTFTQIIKAHKAVVREIKKTAETVPILYVNGNHDFQVTSADIEAAFAGKVQPIGNVYRRRNIHAEHGHMHSLFNHPDMKNDGNRRLPVGYYITRLDVALHSKKRAKFHRTVQIVDEAFQVMGPEKLPESVLDACKDAVEQASKNRETVDAFNMGAGRSESYSEVRERYRNLFDDWRNGPRGFWGSVQMIMCDLRRLGTVADQKCRDGVSIVVFGHSHDTKMDKDSWLVKDRIYANCGYWCGRGEDARKEDHAHFVETDGKTVRLCAFARGRAKQVAKRSL